MAKKQKIKPPESPLRLIRRCAEFQPKTDIKLIPRKRRGLYVLYRRRKRGGREHFNVVYVGMARTSIRARLYSHRRKKGDLWTHFSAFEVWENIRNDEIIELEGLFRHLYRKDKRANILNVQRTFKKAKKAQQNDLKLWT
jgi:hypothetical protein